MGKQIAALFYLGGFDVYIWNYKEINEKDVLRQIKILNKSLNTSVTGALTICSELKDMPDTVTIESVVENLEEKIKLYDNFKKSNMPYFTNSSSFSPSEIGEKVSGFHFFNPISLKLLELYLCNDMDNECIDPIIKYLDKLEFEIIKVNDNRGYIGNYILFNEMSSALKLVEKFNYSADQINRVYSKLYEGRDIFFIIDLIGIDIVYKILSNLKEIDDTIYLPEVLKLALDRGILGRKNKTSIKEVLT